MSSRCWRCAGPSSAGPGSSWSTSCRWAWPPLVVDRAVRAGRRARVRAGQTIVLVEQYLDPRPALRRPLLHPGQGSGGVAGEAAEPPGLRGGRQLPKLTRPSRRLLAAGAAVLAASCRSCPRAWPSAADLLADPLLAYTSYDVGAEQGRLVVVARRTDARGRRRGRRVRLPGRWRGRPTGSQLAFTAGPGGHRRRPLRHAGRRVGRARRSSPPTPACPVWSPDGSMLAFSKQPPRRQQRPPPGRCRRYRRADAAWPTARCAIDDFGCRDRDARRRVPLDWSPDGSVLLIGFFADCFELSLQRAVGLRRRRRRPAGAARPRGAGRAVARRVVARHRRRRRLITVRSAFGGVAWTIGNGATMPTWAPGRRRWPSSRTATCGWRRPAAGTADRIESSRRLVAVAPQFLGDGRRRRLRRRSTASTLAEVAATPGPVTGLGRRRRQRPRLRRRSRRHRAAPVRARSLRHLGGHRPGHVPRGDHRRHAGPGRRLRRRPGGRRGGLGPTSRAAPVLLTQRDSLPASVADAIRRLGVRRVMIVGGPDVVSPAVEAALDLQCCEVIRFNGTDRYGTAGQVAAATAPRQPAFLASGERFPDALAAGPLAYRHEQATLLTRRDVGAAGDHRRHPGAGDHLAGRRRRHRCRRPGRSRRSCCEAVPGLTISPGRRRHPLRHRRPGGRPASRHRSPR